MTFNDFVFDPASSPANASDTNGTAEISGHATITDGDTLEIGGERIRLSGIDAPEARQTCNDRDETIYCGRQATRALADKIGGRPVVCEARGRDRYNRILAICRVDGVDLNGWMVAEGMALAYTQYSYRYVPEEALARLSRAGIWRTEFVPPWAWRRVARRH